VGGGSNPPSNLPWPRRCEHRLECFVTVVTGIYTCKYSVSVSVYFVHRVGAPRILGLTLVQKNSNMAQNCAKITRIYYLKHKSNKNDTSSTVITVLDVFFLLHSCCVYTTRMQTDGGHRRTDTPQTDLHV